MSENAKKKGYNTSYVMLERAFKQYHAPMYFYALKFVDAQDVAKDLVQDAFLKLLNLSEKTKIFNLKAYLYQTLRNNCINHLKSEELKNRYTEQETIRKSREIFFFETHETLVEKELHQKLSNAIEELPEKYKVPLKLSRFEDLKNKEIAERLEIPLRTVETRLYRALNILREKFSGQSLSLFLFFLKKNELC